MRPGNILSAKLLPAPDACISGVSVLASVCLSSVISTYFITLKMLFITYILFIRNSGVLLIIIMIHVAQRKIVRNVAFFRRCCYNSSAMTTKQQTSQDRIVRIPGLVGGKPVIEGTRIPVELVLKYLAYDPDIHTLLEAFPRLT